MNHNEGNTQPACADLAGRVEPLVMCCEVCGNPFSFSWTDTHGIGQCSSCGVPYKIYHYEGEEGKKHRVEKPPELVVKPEYIPVLRAYWNEMKRHIPGGHSFPGGYELATPEDHKIFSEWMRQNAEKHLAHNSVLDRVLYFQVKDGILSIPVCQLLRLATYYPAQ